MGLFRRIGQWFSNSQSTKSASTKSSLLELLDKAHRAQYTGEYDTALDLLQDAYDIAETGRDNRTQIDINLSRADILIAQGDYETARFILTELRDDSETRLLNAPLAYSLCSLGVLEQKLGNLELAQSHFEKARETANAISTDGASGRATGHLGDIYLQQENASYAIYLLEDAVDKLDRSGDRELLGYFLGRLGMAQIHLGERSKGELHLQRGLDVARTIKHTTQIRDLSVLVGDDAFDKGNYRRALSYYEDALKQYPDPPPETGHYATLLAKLSRTALKIGDTFNAELYAQQALPIAITLNDDALIAMMRATMGLVASTTSEDNVEQYLEEAAGYYRDLEPDDFYIEILRNMATAQLKRGEDDIALSTLQEAIDAAKDMPDQAAKVYSELASYYASKRQLREAINTWQKAIKLFEEAHQTDYIAGTHCDIALMYDQLGDGRMAKREYGTALEMLGRIDNNQTRGIILANVAAAYSSYGDIDSAEDFFTESIQIARRNRNIPAEVLRRCNYGRLLVLTARPEDALRQLALTQEHSAELELDLQAGIALNNMAQAMVLLREPDAAHLRFQQSSTILSLVGADLWRARVYANRADFAYLQGDIDTAKEHFETAFKLAQEQSMVDVLIQTIAGRVMIAIAEGRFEAAETELTKIMPTAKRQGYQQLLATLHEARSRLYAKQGKDKQAVSAWEAAGQIHKIMQMPEVTPDWL